MAVFYAHDGRDIPAPGSVVIGEITDGVDALARPGSLNVTFSLKD